jgi:hypothetical protein
VHGAQTHTLPVPTTCVLLKEKKCLIAGIGCSSVCLAEGVHEVFVREVLLGGKFVPHY